MVALHKYTSTICASLARWPISSVLIGVLEGLFEQFRKFSKGCGLYIDKG